MSVALPVTAESPPDELILWVVAAQRGDAEAMDSLLRRFRPALLRLLTAVLGDPAEAEDQVQDAFLHAFRQMDQLRDPTRFYAWLRRLALREALRGQRRWLAVEASMTEPAGPDPAIATDHRLAVQRVLAGLPPQQRAALVLREMEQLDYAEISLALGVPVGTVRSRLFAARESFRRGWKEFEEAP